MAEIKYFAPLHDYQRIAVEEVLIHNSPALFLEAGLGKTLSTLEVIHQMRLVYPDMVTLVIAPLMICETVWEQEGEKWGYPFTFMHLKQDPARRLKLLREGGYNIYMITPEMIPWLHSCGEFPFDFVVIDELTKFKSSSSGRWRQLKQRFVLNKVRRLGLTGTPSPNGYADLWAQMYIVDGGECLGRFKGQFEQDWFIDISNDPRKYSSFVPRRGAREAIVARLKESHVVAMRAKDVIDQKDPIYLPPIKIKLPRESKAIYNELVVEMMATMPDGTVVLPEHDTTISIKLRQVSSGFMIDEDQTIHRLHDNKMKAAKDYVESLDGEPLMIVFTYTAELFQLMSMFPNAGVLAGDVKSADRIESLRAWNNGELDVLIVQPQAAGHGVNAQDGGHHILFYSSDWNLETYEQVIARLNRQGQKSPVFVRHMVAGQIEIDIIRRLNEKSKMQIKLMDDLQEKIYVR